MVRAYFTKRMEREVNICPHPPTSAALEEIARNALAMTSELHQAVCLEYEGVVYTCLILGDDGPGFEFSHDLTVKGGR